MSVASKLLAAYSHSFALFVFQFIDKFLKGGGREEVCEIDIGSRPGTVIRSVASGHADILCATLPVSVMVRATSVS